MREELSGEIFFGDGRVMRRKMIASETERARPDLGDEINRGKGIEDGSTSTATERSVGNERREIVG